jgi:hypothetical protein
MEMLFRFPSGKAEVELFVAPDRQYPPAVAIIGSVCCTWQDEEQTVNQQQYKNRKSPDTVWVHAGQASRDARV